MIPLCHPYRINLVTWYFNPSHCQLFIRVFIIQFDIHTPFFCINGRRPTITRQIHRNKYNPYIIGARQYVWDSISDGGAP